MSKAKRRVVSVICTLLAVIIVLCAAFAGTNAVAVKKYWEKPYIDELSIDTTEFASSLDAYASNLDDTEAAVIECNKKAVPLDAECAEFISACNDMIISFFNDVYSVDVSGKMDALTPLRAEYPEDLPISVGGSYYGDYPELADKLCINGAMLDSFLADSSDGGTLSVDSDVYSAKLLRTIYIHEVVHYLGFTDSALFDNFIEAIVESLNEMIITHAGIKYEAITGYSDIQNLGKRVILADSQMVKDVLGDSSYSIGEHFNAVLKGDNAKKLDELTLIIRNGGDDAKKAAYFAQFIVNEYMKAFSDNPYDLQKTAGRGKVSFFEMKWFADIYK